MRDYLKNMLDALRSNRRVGSTTAIVKAVEDQGGIVVCLNNSEAKRISSFGVKSVSIDRLKSLRGTRDILWFDPSVVEKILCDYEFDVNKKSVSEFLLNEVYKKSTDLQSLSNLASVTFNIPVIGILSEISELDRKGFICIERGLVRSTIK